MGNFKNKKFIFKSKGQVMIFSVISFLAISLLIVTGIVNPVAREYNLLNQKLDSRKSFYVSESGLEDAYYRIKTSKAISSPEVLDVGGNLTFTTTITSTSDQKTISSLGSKSNINRNNQFILKTGTGVTFNYGMQTGAGGIVLNNGSQITGSVYSNGSITGSGAITGTAKSANGSNLTPSETNGSGTPTYDIVFGTANNIQDFAQSFQLSSAEAINKVDLYLKKVGNPNSLTVRIVADNGGVPSTSEITSGTLSSSLVSTTYGWVSAIFSSNPMLSANTTYWFVIDGASSVSSYYTIGGNANGYASGIGKLGQYSSSWADTSPAGLDGFFKVYTGTGTTGLINGITIGTGIVGDAYSHTVNNSTIAGRNYCQTGTGNNKSCITSYTPPVQIPMPISDQNIIDWKTVAEAGGVTTGNVSISGTSSLGPRKITGNLTLNGGSDLTLNGTIWVVGNLILNTNSTLRLSSSYGANEGVVVVDGNITINNNVNFYGSGTSGSYPMLLSTSSSSSAIAVSNNSDGAILYAANGTVSLANNSSAIAINGYSVTLGNNATLNFSSGIVDSNFLSGPSGGWEIDSWKEIE